MNAPKLTLSLLETVRALDGNRADRFIVAETALTAAYTLALQHGNKTQLNDMIVTTRTDEHGNVHKLPKGKLCERGMRTAVQTVGVLGIHKDASTRQAAIEMAVVVALDIFAAIACKESAPRPPKAKAATPTHKELNAKTPSTVTVDVESAVGAVVSLIQTGALTDEEIDAIETALIARRMVAAPVPETALTAH